MAMHISFYIDPSKKHAKGDFDNSRIINGTVSFTWETTCREILLGNLISVVRKNPDYHFYIQMPIADTPDERVLQDMADVMKLPLTVYLTSPNYVYLAGDCKDWVNFNWNISAYLFFLKYSEHLNLLFNDDFIKRQFLDGNRERGVAEKSVSHFCWYVSLTKGFTDFTQNILSREITNNNGIATYFQNNFFVDYPKMINEYKKFIQGIDELVELFNSENYSGYSFKILEGALE